ncbi:cyanophycinase [Pseudomonas petrae]|uniref:Cyanophycinase n=1 Tax=Pseudomonas petrae TaxID=2912190 RepID=A0ABS9I1G0_9PSED|nr:cyanophycinase [Pseudomonas petrae]MCF7532499.1 cyanophycinase [Pseudomonas petrae]MCF7536133.1 cyanophycinase [Pseudomonas petrae]MCF7541643.1 cyanophycinase [Pseudomonas petrae]MCF7557487.1 cyanophycinase [Pseudomonas petrae]
MSKIMRKNTLVAMMIASTTTSVMAEGHLLAVGGMLRASNLPVYHKFVDLGGGPAAAKIVIMPTASGSLSSSKRFQAELLALGLPASHVTIASIDSKNYTQTMNDADAVSPITQASAVWFVGGDQARIAKALINADGSDSLAMQAVRKVYEQGGVIGGTSAGASILGAQMPTAYGVVMDTLDFGVAKSAGQRGVALLKGSGLFTAGIIDQHLDQLEETSTGRTARMASYLIGGQRMKGFGLDTNTAMWVKPGGQIEVIGEGYLTIMDASHATKQFGVYGTELHNVRLAMLGDGDRYDLSTDAISPAEGKEIIKAGDQYLIGNQLITDLSAVAAMRRAVLYGLADNTATRQVGLMTRYNPLNGYHYGYRFEFSKTPDFVAHSKSYDSLTNYSAQGVRLDVTPVDAWLKPAQKNVPIDVLESPEFAAVRAVVFRGLMTCNESNAFEPDRAITRGELANTSQMALAGEMKVDKRPVFIDLPADSPLLNQAEIVVSNGWMKSGPEFQASRPVSSAEWAEAGKVLIAQGRNTTLILNPPEGTTVRRDEVAHLVASVFELDRQL